MTKFNLQQLLQNKQGSQDERYLFYKTLIWFIT